MTREIKITKSSGNVFADLGFKDAQERLVKAKLALKINQLLDKRELKQIDAAKILGINQPKISALANGRLKDFSIEKLLGFLIKLDQDIDIIVHQKPKRRKAPARFSVELAA
jgi:predicted XRE-type DNA-binding protein